MKSEFQYCYDHVCILYGHMEPDRQEFAAMYEKIETDDEGDITIKKVVEHIRAVEAGGGNNEWVRYLVIHTTHRWINIHRSFIAG